MADSTSGTTVTGPPACPKHGSPMVLRTARNGPRAGGKFWGCSRYPSCRAIIDVDEHGRPSAPPTVGRRPRQVWAEHGRRGHWTALYTTGGGRLRSWDAIARDPEREALSRATSHIAVYSHGLTDQPDGSVAVDVLRKILCRGDRPPVDPRIEQWILESAGLGGSLEPPRDPGDLTPRLSAAADIPDAASVTAAVLWREPFRFDDQARLVDGEPYLARGGEDRLVADIIPAVWGPVAGNWVMPQAPFAPLLGDPRDQRRADFLVCHPAVPTFVVEVDGGTHVSNVEVDRDRDQSLAAAGIEVRRFPANLLGGPPTDVGLNGVMPPLADASERDLLLVWGPPVAHRILRALVEAVAGGALRGPRWTVRLEEPLGIGPEGIRSAVEIIAAVAAVWPDIEVPDRVDIAWGGGGSTLERRGPADYSVIDADTPLEADVHLVIDVFHGPFHELPVIEDRPAIVVRSAYLPVDLREGRLEGSQRRTVPDPDGIAPEALDRLLQALFAKREFYPAGADRPRGQELAIRRVLGGRDSVVLLPTGAGKSLIYQFAGLLMPGRCLIIDPIVALIDDQLDGLQRQGIDRALGITRADTIAGATEAKLKEVAAGDAFFCFVAPERLQHRAFRDAVRALTVAAPVNLCVIDEAHCVSEWGHQFRTSYLDIGRVLRWTAADTRGSAPPLLALTGTASRAVLRDMLIELDIDRSDPAAIITPADFDRPELTFDIVPAREDEVFTRLVGALRSLPARFRATEAQFFQSAGPDSRCGVVFTQIVSPSRTHPDGGLLNIQARLERELGVRVGIYAGSRPKYWAGSDWEAARRADARAFKDNELTMLVATNAYGMGIDKPNIRYIVHIGVPGSIEAYYQEAGRAGRDRHASRCLLVHDSGDRGFHEFMQGNNFRGVDADVVGVARLLDAIGDLTERRTVFVPKSSADAAADDEERAIHRLKLLGVVRDYLIDFGGSRFELLLEAVDLELVDGRLVEYVRRTQPGRVLAFQRELDQDPPTDLRTRIIEDARRLIAFIYETVVHARRRALDEMVMLADEARTDAEIRDRILRYLELGRVANELEAVVDLAPFTFEVWQSLYLTMDTIDDGREWRGATARFLESAPDHPGLLAGRAMAEAVLPGGDINVFGRTLRAALVNADGPYSVPRDDLAGFVDWLLGWLHDRRPRWAALGYLIAERALGDDHLDHLYPAEQRVLVDDRAASEDELAIVVTRRIERDLRSLRSMVRIAQEMI